MSNSDPATPRPITVLIWGTCDLGKPRMRIIVAALAEVGLPVELQRIPVWDGVEDKSGLRGPAAMLRFGFRYLWAILRLWFMYLRAPPHDVVLIGYLGQFDVLAIRPLAWVFGKPVVWDAFLSLYDTVVIDRKLLREGGAPARVLRWLERSSCRSADIVVLDTEAHARRFSDLFAVPEDRLASVPVGAEPGAFPPLPRKAPSGDAPLTILFYGQFIPLHGVSVIIEAARLAQERNWRWRLIGTGQEASRIRADLEENPLSAIDWIEWVPYLELSSEIATADICLGVFGESEKAASVVPNKVYQIIASGRPLVTRDSPAMRELAPDETQGLVLVPEMDPAALVVAISELEENVRSGALVDAGLQAIQNKFSTSEIGKRWSAILEEVAKASRK